MPESPATVDSLRLRRPELLTLAALSDPQADPQDLDPDDLAALRSIGLVEDAGVNAAVSGIAAAVRAPVVQLRLEALGPGRRAYCAGWVDGDVAVLAVPGPDGVDDIKSASTPFLPARLAEFLGLGPRPPATGSWRVDGASFDACTLQGGDADTDGVAALLGPSGAAADAAQLLRLINGLRLHWRVTAAWRGGHRSLETVDASGHGVWRVQRDEDGTAHLLPTSATEIWKALIRLLPTDAELG